MLFRSLTTLVAAAALAGCQAAPDGAKADGSKPEGKSKIVSLFRAEPIIIPEGTVLPLVLQTSLSSKGNNRGDLVVAKLAAAVKLGEKVVLPAGTEVRGEVRAAAPSGHVKTRARLAWDFDRVIVKGKEYAIETRAVDITAPSTRKHDAAVIGGGAGAGALIGALVDGKKGAGVGALLGGAAGTGVVLAETGKEVQVPAGSRISVKLTREAQLG